MDSSEISGFYKKSLGERIAIAKKFANLDKKDIEELENYGAMSFEIANRMAENVIGTQQLPLGIATNFQINGKDYLVPMALEEPSVIAAASKAAGIARETKGFKAKASPPVMIGQVQLVNVKDCEKAINEIKINSRNLVDLANNADPVLVKFGGGAKKIETRIIGTKKGKMVIAHLLVDVRDAMGANAVNTRCEAVAPMIEKITGGQVYLRIISNLATERLVKAKCIIPKEADGSWKLAQRLKGNS